MHIKKIILLTVLCLTTLLAAREEINSKNVEKLFDSIMPDLMEEDRVPSAYIVVVKDNKVVLKKGWGSVNLESESEISFSNNYFQYGSISKLITATAIMQLYERGKIDLHDDINNYLKDIKIERKFEEPITVAHLLTHTAGFDDITLNLASLSQENMGTISEYLQSIKMKQVRPAGDIVSYSNYGYTLLGQIIEDVSGIDYVDFLKENIFNPLGMTTIDYLFTDNFYSGVVQDYVPSGSSWQPAPAVVLKALPAGGFWGSPKDLSNFMTAHLNKGELNGVRILRKETVNLMHSQQFGSDKRIDGWCYGFYESHENLRFIEHGGDLNGYANRMILLPEENTGLILFTTAKNFNLRGSVISSFLNTFFPAKDLQIDNNELAGFKKRSSEVTGSYTLTRSGISNIEKTWRLFQVVNIKAKDSGRIIFDPPWLFKMVFNITSVEYLEIEPYLFKEVGGHRLLKFNKKNGVIKYAESSMMGVPTHLESLSFYETPKYYLIILLFSIIFFIFSSVRLFWIPLLKREINLRSIESLGRGFSGFAAFLNNIFLIIFPMFYVLNYGALIYKVNPGFTLLLTIPLLSIVLQIPALYSLIRLIINKRKPVVFMLINSAVCLLQIPVLLSLNLIGYNY